MKMLFEKLSYINKLWTEVNKRVDRHIAETFQFPEILLDHVDNEIADEFDAYTGMSPLPIP
jgi:hypothetical protein